MPADLKTASDRPQAVLITSLLGTTVAQVAATALDEYEHVNDVTFAALDNDALAAVREAYALTDESVNEPGVSDLRDAIRDLLGLEDA